MLLAIGLRVVDTTLFGQNGNCGSVLKNNIWNSNLNEEICFYLHTSKLPNKCSPYENI